MGLADEARVQMVRDGHDLQREIDIELEEMEELMRDEEMCQACEDRKLDMLAYEEQWAKMMLVVRKTDTPQDFRDGVAMKALRENRRGRDRQRLVTRAVRISTKSER